MFFFAWYIKFDLFLDILYWAWSFSSFPNLFVVVWRHLWLSTNRKHWWRGGWRWLRRWWYLLYSCMYVGMYLLELAMRIPHKRFHADMRLCFLDIYICTYIFRIRMISMRFHAYMQLYKPICAYIFPISIVYSDLI